jgi:glycosyltransferase involved in cell wall biosynthesis
MRVIHIVLGKANPERMNGVNKVAHSMVIHQKKIGADAEIWGITKDPHANTIERTYKTHFFGKPRNPFEIPNSMRKSILAEKKNTFFHLHAGFIPVFYKLSAFLIEHGYQYAITPHGNFMDGAMQKNNILKKVYFRFWEKRILINAKFIHCIGSGEIEDLKKMGVEANFKLVPNGQNLEDFNFEFENIAKKYNTPILGFCGRLSMHHKGLDLLSEAFLQYKTKLNGKGSLWIIGDGEYYDELVQFVEKNNLQNDMVLWGSKFGAEKLNIMANMDAFYHPSRNEGLPMAVLEAAVLKKPLILSHYTNMVEYLKKYDSGICLEENTIEEIAQSMLTIEKELGSEKMKAWSNNAYKMFEENFNWDKIAKDLLQLYA